MVVVVVVDIASADVLVLLRADVGVTTVQLACDVEFLEGPSDAAVVLFRRILLRVAPFATT
jgi:soluble P-type ATPase